MNSSTPWEARRTTATCSLSRLVSHYHIPLPNIGNLENRFPKRVKHLQQDLPKCLPFISSIEKLAQPMDPASWPETCPRRRDTSRSRRDRSRHIPGRLLLFPALERTSRKSRQHGCGDRRRPHGIRRTQQCILHWPPSVVVSSWISSTSSLVVPLSWRYGHGECVWFLSLKARLPSSLVATIFRVKFSIHKVKPHPTLRRLVARQRVPDCERTPPCDRN